MLKCLPCLALTSFFTFGFDKIRNSVLARLSGYSLLKVTKEGYPFFITLMRVNPETPLGLGFLLNTHK